MGILEDIYHAVVNGRVEDAPAGVTQALDSGLKVDDILNNGLISAMDFVGQRFADAEVFIPHVIWSAKAMQAGMNRLKPHFSEDRQLKSVRIVVGTALGDIHDIGKNLVAMMLEGAGFEVFDLGVDVAPQKFVETAVEEKAHIIAVSALLTTTMASMVDLVDLITKRQLSSVKVLIGGAPVSQEFCREIGADAYGVDARDAVIQVRKMISA